MNVSTPALIFWLRRAQLPESAVIYFATASATLTLLGIVAATLTEESFEIPCFWAAGLLVGAIPHLAGIRPIVIGIFTVAMIVIIAFFPPVLTEMPTLSLLLILFAPVVMYLVALMDTRTRLVRPTLVCLAGLSASFLWLAPMGHLLSDPEDTTIRLGVQLTCFLPSLFAITATRSRRGHLFAWLLPGDQPESAFRIVGLFIAGLAGLGIASWVTINLRASLLSTPLESIINIAGWFAGVLTVMLVLWTVLKLPAAFSRGQLSGRFYPRAIAESTWIVIMLGAVAIFFELSRKQFGTWVLLVLGVVVVYATVRLLMSAPLPPGQAPLWIVTLKPVDRRLRAAVHKLAAEWKAGPTTLLAPPEAARKLADAHLRACVRTRTLDRLFPLRSAHLADWDDGLPPQHAWNTLPLRELYANPSMWPEILAARLAPPASLIALQSDVTGVVVRATTDTLRLSPGLDAKQLEDIASQPLQTGKQLVGRLREMQKTLNARTRDVLILHSVDDLQAAWELRGRLAGVNDATGAVIRPFVIPLERIAPPMGCNGVFLGMARRLLERHPGAFGVNGLAARTLLRLSAPKPADEYDLVVIEPAQKPASNTARLSTLLGLRIADGVFDRVVSVRSPASGTEGPIFASEMYSDSIAWSSSPALSARAADAAQKLLASPVRKSGSAGAENVHVPEAAEAFQVTQPPQATTPSQTSEAVPDEIAANVTMELPHDDRISYASFAPRAPCILTTSRDCTARLWNARSGQRLGAVLKHENTITHADFDPGGRLIVTGGRDAAVKLWSIDTGELLAVLLGHTAPVVHVAFDPTGSRVVSSGDLAARIWDVGERTIIVQVRHEAQIVRAEFAPDENTLLTCSHDHTARMWIASTGRPLGEEMRHARAVNYATFSPDGRLVATASEDGSAVLWDARSGHPIGRLFRHKKPIRRVAFSPDGRLLATASADETAGLWDVSSGQRLATLAHWGAVNCVTFSPNGRRLATASDDGMVREWSTEGGAMLEARGVSGHAYFVAYDPQTTRLIAIDASTSAKLWSIE